MSLLSNIVKSVTGSSITGLVSAVAAPAASYFGGPLAGALTSTLTGGGYFGSPTPAPTPISYPMAYPGGAPIYQPAMATLGSIGGVAGRIGSSAAGILGLSGLTGGLIKAGAGVLRTAAGAIRGVVLASGKFISSRKAAALARRVGIDSAAAALGIGAVELAEMVLSDSERRGRRGRRGISSADMKRTRSTIRRVESLHRQIVSACSSAHVPMRRGSSRRAATVVQACLPRMK